MSSNVPFTQFLDAYSGFCSAIRSHIAYADSRPEVRAALTDTTRIAFLEIIRRASIKHPEQPIWIRVDRTAERLGICGRSVSRTIKMMREKGWLVPSATHDGRNSQGEFDGREYLLTPAMRRLMGLPIETNLDPSSEHNLTPPEYPAPTPAIPQTGEERDEAAHPLQNGQPSSPLVPKNLAALPTGSSLSKALAIAQRRAEAELAKRQLDSAKPTNAADLPVEKPVDNVVLPSGKNAENCPDRTDLSSGVIYEVNKVFSLKEASLHKRGLFENTETGKTIRLPLDLLPLVEELGIKPEGVCKLMRLAGANGHRLQDVWAVKREHLLNSGAREGRAVRYLEFLLNCGEDFAYRATTKIPSHGSKAPASTVTRTPSSPRSQGASKAPVSSDQPEANGALAKLMTIAKASRFKRFRHVSNGMLVRFYDGIAEVTRGLERTIVAGWDKLEGYYVGISRGNLLEVTE